MWEEGSFTDGPYNNNLASAEKHIGDEIDFTFEMQTETGLRFQSISGLFLPGAYLEDYNKNASMFFQRLGVEFVF